LARRRYFCEVIMSEDFDFNIAPTQLLVDFANAGVKLADAILDRLTARHPRDVWMFFPAETSPIADFAYASLFGDETLGDVKLCCETVILMARAREELEIRRRPN
jgi:hypothetical protein